MILKEEDFNRLITGIRINVYNRPYTIDYIEDLIQYFEKIEHYEKCGQLLNVLNQIKDHNLGYVK